MSSCSQNVENEENAAVFKMAGIPRKILVMSGKGGVGQGQIHGDISRRFK